MICYDFEIYKDIKGIDVEKILRSLSKNLKKDIELYAKLPIPLQAKVLRNKSCAIEIVKLTSGNKNIDLFRDKDENYILEKIEVSCRYAVNESLVDTIILHFHDYNDIYTDRGIAWIYPGDPATAHFIIKEKALKIPGLITEIITTVEEIIKTKVLSYFLF